MDILTEQGVQSVYHYAPLHYLVFIARSRQLLSKPTLQKQGFSESHLRSKSCKQDIARGFGRYAFLTLDNPPRILQAKLAAGFPHIGIRIPPTAVEACTYHLCRFNVAMTRRLRRDGKSGFEASASNGRYYPGHQIPIAKTNGDKRSLLSAHFATRTMIEVLIEGDIPLPDDTQIICYSDEDVSTAETLLETLKCPWPAIREPGPGDYPRRGSYAKEVTDFIVRALQEPAWRGNGLEFDRV